MNSNQILSDQVIHLKRGRMNRFGWEPAWNSYFDFYLNTKYFEKPLLELEDVTFHLYLRKNLNDTNPSWRMPSMRQMQRRFSIGQHRIESIINRLELAHLLKKESGYRAGPDGMNIRNDYILSDPIQTAEEFVAVAAEGVFRYPLKQEWCSRNDYSPGDPVAETATLGEAGLATQEQTLIKQTWDKILDSLKSTMLPTTFNMFLADTKLEINGQTALIKTPNTFAHDWLQNRMKEKLLKLLNHETIYQGLVLIDLKCEA